MQKIIGFIIMGGIAFSFLHSRTNILKPNCNIKGNISVSSGRKIYHVPGQEDYKNTIISPGKGEKYFCSEEEAIKAGWTKAPR